jgi:hypothetical protein
MSGGPGPSFIILINTVDYAVYYEEYQYLIKQGYSVPKAILTAGWNVYNEKIHVLLDVAGFVPVFGELADGLNLVIYAWQGDIINATFSAISMVPVGGDIAAKGVKYAIAKVAAGKILIKGKSYYLKGSALSRINRAIANNYSDDIVEALAISFN